MRVTPFLIAALALLGCDDSSAIEDDAAPKRPDVGGGTTDGGAGGAIPPNGVCSPGDTRCVDGMLRTCIDDATGWLVQACGDAEACVEGACVELDCDPGSRRCADESSWQRCDGDGRAWSESRPCPDDTTCQEGVCLERNCDPGERACADKAVLICDDDGLHWSREACADRCIDGECAEAPGADCEPGQVLCAPTGIVRCADDGHSFIEMPCPDGQACFEGGCVACVRDRDCPDDGVCEDGECAVAPLTVLTEMLPPAQLDVPYLIDIEAAFGTPLYRWEIVDGALPDGVALAANGALAGTPTEAGNFDFTAQVTDVSGDTAQAELTLPVLPDGLVIATESPLPDAEEGEPYEAQFEAVGGVAPYGWIVVDGALPGGLRLGADGRVQGTPNEIGPFEFTMRVVDAGDPPGFAEKVFNLEIEVAPLRIVADQVFDLFITQVITLPIITVVEGIPIPYRAQLQARGGLRPYHWSEVPVADGLRAFLPQAGIPDGLVLEEGGTLQGAVVDTGAVIELVIPFTMIRLTGFFFTAEVADSQGIADTASAVFVLPTPPIGGN